MNKQKEKIQKKDRKRFKIRSKITGTKEIPRLNVFKSNKSIFLQIIDDEAGKTLASVHSKDIKDKGNKTEIGTALGKLLAEKAKKDGITKVVFDRGGCKYHGRVKAVADGAREGGLEF